MSWGTSSPAQPPPLPQVLKGARDAAQASVGPVPASRLENRVGAAQMPLQQGHQAGHRHLCSWRRVAAGLEPAPSGQAQCLRTGFSSCPQDVGVRVVPSAGHPADPPPTRVSAPRAERSAQQGWVVGRVWLWDQVTVVINSRGSHCEQPRAGQETTTGRGQPLLRLWCSPRG